MKLNAVAVSSKNLQHTINFYSLIGFQFPPVEPDQRHIEAVATKGSARLMIDSAELMSNLLGHAPQPGNHSSFAIQYDTPEDVDKVIQKLEKAGYMAYKAPWDAFWGQRYAVVKDPDGYLIDLYAYLPNTQ